MVHQIWRVGFFISTQMCQEFNTKKSILLLSKSLEKKTYFGDFLVRHA